MKLAGLQKLTLLDYPGQLACTVFTLGCNLRCPFCQNADLVLPERFAAGELLPEDTFFSFLESRKGRLSAVAVSGGEPTLHRDLPQFLSRIWEMGFLVKLDTNGTNPDMLKHVVKEGLVNYVAMDVKNTPQKYLLTCGLPEETAAQSEVRPTSRLLDNIQESISFLMEDSVPYEFRTTVVAGLHTEEDITGIAKWLQGARAWYLQQFMPGDAIIGFGSDGDGSKGDGTDLLRSPSAQMLQRMCESGSRYVPAVQVRGV